jgi:predicted HNH restriction endonuclease
MKKPGKAAWSREELILALDLYLQRKPTVPDDTDDEVITLSALLRAMAIERGEAPATNYRSPNSVAMKLMNFRALDPDYAGKGLDGTSEGDREIWAEFSGQPETLAPLVLDILAKAPKTAPSQPPYWVFICNPKKWAIDRFLHDRIERDTWGVRKADQHKFAPGQLALVRVGVDRRSKRQLGGNAPLKSGIYALCEIESECFPAKGAGDKYWATGAERAAGWPTVRVRYLRTYGDKPLTIDEIRRKLPGVSPLLLNGFQASSMPIGADDFHAITALLGDDVEALSAPDVEAPDTTSKLAELEKRYMRASPEAKSRLSKRIERGPIGAEVKKANGFKCQLCEAMGQSPYGFKKTSGEYYVEAHHVMPVSKREVGSLSASNIVCLCANHHRQVHYGAVTVSIGENSFSFIIDGVAIELPRYRTHLLSKKDVPARASA